MKPMLDVSFVKLDSPEAVAAREAYQRKLDENVYSLESKPCFCGAEQDTVLTERDKFGLYHPFVLCQRCGLIRAKPHLTLGSYAQFYDKEFRVLYGNPAIDLEQQWPGQERQGEQSYELLAPFLTSSGKTVFEIGCFMGGSLYPFSKRGWDVAGVDFGSQAIEFGRRKTGIASLYSGGIEELERLNKKADLIITNHVVEHFVDLEGELGRIRALLKPGGLFFVGLPGTYWWPVYACQGNLSLIWQNAHCWQFTLSSFRYVAECSGFEQVYGDEMIRGLFRRTDSFRPKADVVPGEYAAVKKALWRMQYLSSYYKLRALAYVVAVKVLDALRLKKVIKRILGWA